MPDVWIPGFNRINLGLHGGPYDDTRKPKALWHTTEGASIAGARRAFASYPPHICYDARFRTGEQYVPLNRHSYSLRGAESDDEYCIQIELVGFAGQTHTWSEEILRNIGMDLIRPLRELAGVPDIVVWHGFVSEAEANRRGFRLASARSPIRLTDAQLREFSGHLAHQHAPPPDEHWDAGGLNIHLAIRLSYSVEVVEEEEEVFAMAEGQVFYAKGDKDASVYLIKVQFDKPDQPLVRRHVLPTEFSIAIQGGAKLAILKQAEFDAIPKIQGSK